MAICPFQISLFIIIIDIIEEMSVEAIIIVFKFIYFNIHLYRLEVLLKAKELQNKNYFQNILSL
jgi:hypothetical protein